MNMISKTKRFSDKKIVLYTITLQNDHYQKNFVNVSVNVLQLQMHGMAVDQKVTKIYSI